MLVLVCLGVALDGGSSSKRIGFGHYNHSSAWSKIRHRAIGQFLGVTIFSIMSLDIVRIDPRPTQTHISL